METLTKPTDTRLRRFTETGTCLLYTSFGEFVLETSQPALHLRFLGGTAQQRQYLVVVVALGYVCLLYTSRCV